MSLYKEVFSTVFAIVACIVARMLNRCGVVGTPGWWYGTWDLTFQDYALLAVAAFLAANLLWLSVSAFMTHWHLAGPRAERAAPDLRGVPDPVVGEHATAPRPSAWECVVDALSAQRKTIVLLLVCGGVYAVLYTPWTLASLLSWGPDVYFYWVVGGPVFGAALKTAGPWVLQHLARMLRPPQSPMLPRNTKPRAPLADVSYDSWSQSPQAERPPVASAPPAPRNFSEQPFYPPAPVFRSRAAAAPPLFPTHAAAATPAPASVPDPDSSPPLPSVGGWLQTGLHMAGRAAMPALERVVHAVAAPVDSQAPSSFAPPRAAFGAHMSERLRVKQREMMAAAESMYAPA